ncbi:MAG TPA: hypothetical protein VFV37_05340 [Luteibaculaceae bacterium]|nr:hypothetical protein [Luteibaculaceae bacterium]
MELGLLFFLVIICMAFWMLIFLFGVAIPYWISLAIGQSLAKKFGIGQKKSE